MTLRVGYLCGEYPRVSDTFIQREVGALRKQGFQVRTFSIRRPQMRERGTEEQEAERAATCYVLPASPWRLIADHLRLLVSAPWRYLRALWLAVTVRSPGMTSLMYQLFYFVEAGIVACWMKDQRLQHLHNHAPDASGYVAMIASEMGGFTYSITLHGPGIFWAPSRWRLSEKLDRALFVICISWFARSQAMLWSKNWRNWANLHVVHCGVDVSDFQPRHHHGRGKQLLFVGRFDHVKGLFLLIDAFEELACQRPDLHLDLVGDGPQRAELEAVVREKRLHQQVTFHGYLSQAEIRQRLHRADICVMASFAEGVPVVLMEAMAAGVAIVAPRIAGIPELIEHGQNGLLFHAGDAYALREAIERLLDDPDLRNELAERGRSVVAEEFNLDTEVERLVAIMQARLSGQSVPVRPAAVAAANGANSAATAASYQKAEVPTSA